MDCIKKIFSDRLNYIIQNDPVLANDFDKDNNNIGIILAISNILKTLRLIVLLFNFSYFIGMSWIIICTSI